MKKDRKWIIGVLLVFAFCGVMLYQITNTKAQFMGALLASAPIFFAIIALGIYFRCGEERTIKNELLFLCSFLAISTVYMIILSRFITLDIADLFFRLIVISLATLAGLALKTTLFTTMEKGILILSLGTLLVAYLYINHLPSTEADLYLSTFPGDQVTYEQVHELFLKPYRDNFTREDFEFLEPYLTQHPLTINQPLVLEFEGGTVVLLETVRGYAPLTLRDITLLPEEMASHFRHFPLQLERDTTLPPILRDDDGVIEVRGAFVSSATPQQRQDWDSQLVSVFGEIDLPEELFAPQGPIRGMGVSRHGYLEVRFFGDWQVDSQILEDVYDIYQQEASNQGIEQLPMVFRRW